MDNYDDFYCLMSDTDGVMEKLPKFYKNNYHLILLNTTGHCSTLFTLKKVFDL